MDVSLQGFTIYNLTMNFLLFPVEVPWDVLCIYSI